MRKSCEKKNKTAEISEFNREKDVFGHVFFVCPGHGDKRLSIHAGTTGIKRRMYGF